MIVFQYLRGAAACALLVILPFAQLIAVRLGPAFVGFALLMCIIALIGARDGGSLREQFSFSNPITKKFAYLLAGLFIWASLSLAWSLDIKRGLYILMLFSITIAAIWFLSNQFAKLPPIRFKILVFLGGLCTITTLILGMKIIGQLNASWGINHAHYDYNRIAIALCFLIWPLLYLAIQGRISLFLALFLLILSGYAIFISRSETAKLGFLISTSTAFICWLIPHIKKLTSIAMGNFIFIMPFLPSTIDALQPYTPRWLAAYGSMNHRVQIWKGYADLAFEKWLTGWGMSSDRLLGKIGKAGAYTEQTGYSSDISAPHNFALELWVNIGFIGVLLVVFSLFLTGWVELKSKYHNAIFIGFVASAFTMSLTGPSGFQGWLLAAFVTSGMALRTLILYDKETGQR